MYVEIIAEEGKIKVEARNEISLKSKKIVMAGGGARFELSGSNPKFNLPPRAPDYFKGSPNITVSAPEKLTTPKILPRDRGKRYNEGLSDPVDRKEVESVIEIDEQSEGGDE